MTLYSIVYDGSEVEEGNVDTHAADWNPDKGKWCYSCKEYGLGHKWEFQDTLPGHAYKAILKHFRLSQTDVSIDKIEKMSPNALYNLTWQNPKSQTLGDKRLAAEVM